MGTGMGILFNREHEKALHTYERARELNPNDSDLLAEMANLLIYIGGPKKRSRKLRMRSVSIPSTRPGISSIWDGLMKKPNASEGRRDPRTGN